MWTKICGITNVDNARCVVAAGPDAIGLNFYSGTPRCVDADEAARIVEMLPAEVTPVGVFVNHAPGEVDAICNAAGIRVIQLHGDETPETVADIAATDTNRHIIRAFRVGADGLGEVDATLHEYERLGVELFACLIDARAPGQYGGSGRTAPWELLRDGYDFENNPPLILAGGLTPDNVAEAIQVVSPWGVDVAGGVESAPGEKDEALVRGFVEAAREH